MRKSIAFVVWLLIGLPVSFALVDTYGGLGLALVLPVGYALLAGAEELIG